LIEREWGRALINVGLTVGNRDDEVSLDFIFISTLELGDSFFSPSPT